jgi:enamine deaminase RidA (YjgF/YER057c/UK114 family)
VLYVSGQTSNAADGSPMHAGDIVAQFRLAWSNLKDALAAAGMDPTNIVRLIMYTTDVDGFMDAAGDLVPIFAGGRLHAGEHVPRRHRPLRARDHCRTRSNRRRLMIRVGGLEVSG